MNDTVGVILMLCFLIGVFIVGPIIIYNKNQKKIIKGSFTVKNKHYNYFIGNNITFRRHGIVVKLGKPLPAIYLDTLSSANEKQATIDTFFNATNLSLEGDFSNYFQLFCVYNNEREALRVLTPDVMLILKEFVNKYDIEINGSELWILSEKKIYSNTALSHDMILCATHLVEKLDRITEVNNFDITTLEQFDSRYVRTINIFGHYVSKSIFYITAFCLFLFIAIWLSVLYAYIQIQEISYIGLLLSLIIFPFFPYLMYVTQKKEGTGIVKLKNNNSRINKVVISDAIKYIKSFLKKN